MQLAWAAGPTSQLRPRIAALELGLPVATITVLPPTVQVAHPVGERELYLRNGDFRAELVRVVHIGGQAHQGTQHLGWTLPANDTGNPFVDSQGRVVSSGPSGQARQNRSDLHFVSTTDRLGLEQGGRTCWSNLGLTVKHDAALDRRLATANCQPKFGQDLFGGSVAVERMWSLVQREPLIYRAASLTSRSAAFLMHHDGLACFSKERGGSEAREPTADNPHIRILGDRGPLADRAVGSWGVNVSHATLTIQPPQM